MHARRAFDGASGLSQPIGWRDLQAWSAVTDTPLAAHEIRLLTALDDYLIAEERKQRAKEQRQSKSKRKK